MDYSLESFLGPIASRHGGSCSTQMWKLFGTGTTRYLSWRDHCCRGCISFPASRLAKELLDEISRCVHAPITSLKECVSCCAIASGRDARLELISYSRCVHDQFRYHCHCHVSLGQTRARRSLGQLIDLVPSSSSSRTFKVLTHERSIQAVCFRPGMEHNFTRCGRKLMRFE